MYGRLPLTVRGAGNQRPRGVPDGCMTFHKVETLFHEMGHWLQHMLVRAIVGEVSGINEVKGVRYCGIAFAVHVLKM